MCIERTVRRGALALMVLALVGGLSGCGGGSTAGAGASTGPATAVASAPVAPSATPTPTPTVAPAGEKNTVASAERAVRHYIAVVNNAYKTGDIDEVRALSASSCKTCARYISSIRAIYAAEETVLRGTTTIKKVIASGETAPGVRQVVVDYSASGLVLRKPDGSVKIVEPASQGDVNRYDLIFRDGAWQVLRVVILK